MKKILVIALVAFGVSSVMNAQDVWAKKSAPATFSYLRKTITDDAGVKRSGNGVAITKMRTYYLGDPLGGKVRFGLDATWMDMRFVMYSKPQSMSTNIKTQLGIHNVESTTGKTFGSMGAYFDAASNEATDFSDLKNLTFDATKVNFGSMDIGYYMGIGPSIKVIPTDVAKISAYFHWKPGVEARVTTGPGENPTIYWAPMLRNFAVGLNLAHKRFGYGFEYTFGQAKYSKLAYCDDDESDPHADGITHKTYFTAGFDKYAAKEHFKSSTFRVYLGFRF